MPSVESVDKSFVIVGGPSRSATDGVSAFLNLHDDVAAFSTAGLRPDRKPYYNDFKAAKKSCQPALSDNNLYNNYLKGKNLSSDIDKAKIIVLRRDHGEDTFEPLKSISDEYLETKLIYSLRRNLFNIFTSQAYNMLPRVEGSCETGRGAPITDWQIEQFHRNITRSFEMMAELIEKYPDDILLVDISHTEDPNFIAERRRYHQKILDFLGIESSFMQKQWIKELPPSNRRGPGEHESLQAFRLDNLKYTHTFDYLKDHKVFKMVTL